MLKSYIVSVLSYFDSQVDIFQVYAPETGDGITHDDVKEYIEEMIESRGYHLSDCHWMISDPNQFKFKVDL